MKNYALIDGGVLVSTVSCSPDQLDIYIAENPSLEYLEIPFLRGVDELYFNGKNIVERPQRPSDWHRWDNGTNTWVETRSLDDFKAQKWRAIKIARESAITAPIVTAFGTFDATAGAQKSITDAVLMLQTMEAMGNPQTIDFTLANNTTATLTTAQMVQVGLMLGAQTQAAYAKGRVLRAQIEAATSVADVEAITW
jgi:hypothetical protein